MATQFFADSPQLYLFHRKWFVAHSARLDGLKMLPDGLIRVNGLVLK
jgi:peptide/nickel transport system substrate-binding protein